MTKRTTTSTSRRAGRSLSFSCAPNRATLQAHSGASLQLTLLRAGRPPSFTKLAIPGATGKKSSCSPRGPGRRTAATRRLEESLSLEHAALGSGIAARTVLALCGARRAIAIRAGFRRRRRHETREHLALAVVVAHLAVAVRGARRRGGGPHGALAVPARPGVVRARRHHARVLHRPAFGGAREHAVTPSPRPAHAAVEIRLAARRRRRGSLRKRHALLAGHALLGPLAAGARDQDGTPHARTHPPSIHVELPDRGREAIAANHPPETFGRLRISAQTGHSPAPNRGPQTCPTHAARRRGDARDASLANGACSGGARGRRARKSGVWAPLERPTRAGDAGEPRLMRGETRGWKLSANTSFVRRYMRGFTCWFVRVELERAFSDGTVAVDMDPLSLLCRLAAALPPPRFHVLRCATVLQESRVAAQVRRARSRAADAAVYPRNAGGALHAARRARRPRRPARFQHAGSVARTLPLRWDPSAAGLRAA